jgi:hypothetical protein
LLDVFASAVFDDILVLQKHRLRNALRDGDHGLQAVVQSL